MIPSQGYFDVKGSGHYAENQTANVGFDCTNCLSYADTNTASTAGNWNSNLWTMAENFHSEVDNSNWNDARADVIGGYGIQTIVGIREYTRCSTMIFGVCITTEHVMGPIFVSQGNRTVTIRSVRAHNPDTGVNLRRDSSFCVFEAGHLSTVRNADVLAYVDELLGLGPIVECPSTDIAEARPTPTHRERGWATATSRIPQKGDK